MSDIVVMGSLNADLVVQVDRAPRSGETVLGKSFSVFNGGKGANQAYAAARLGASVGMIGRVGDDVYGREQVRSLASVGVSTKGIRAIDAEPTGTAVITVDGSGENRIVVVAGANGAFDVASLQQDLGLLRESKYALFQLETPLDTVVEGLRAARAAGVATLLDPAPAQPLSDATLELAEYVTPNLSELRELTDEALEDPNDTMRIAEAARSLIRRGAGKVIVKLGALGALFVAREGQELVPGYKVVAVDTTAAGDCFNAAFAVALSRGDVEGEAARFACAAAALAVTRRGAQAGMPTGAEVAAFRG